MSLGGCCSLGGLTFLGSEGAAEADDQEDEEPDPLGGPKADHHNVIVVHGPQRRAAARHANVGSSGRREQRAIALHRVRCEQHRAAGDQDGHLEQEGEEGAVGLSGATDVGPASPDAKETV